MSQIAILGTGPVGRAIGVSLTRAGHRVVLASRGVDRVSDEGLVVRGYREAIEGADAVVIAVPGEALAITLGVHAALLDGRLLLDATNNIEAATYHQLDLFAQHVPNARVARVWCSLGWPNFLEPVINGVSMDLFWCGPSGADGELIHQLVASTGLNPVRTGGLETVNIVDTATRLVLSLIFQAGFPHELGLKLVR